MTAYDYLKQDPVNRAPLIKSCQFDKLDMDNGTREDLYFCIVNGIEITDAMLYLIKQYNEVNAFYNMRLKKSWLLQHCKLTALTNAMYTMLQLNPDDPYLIKNEAYIEKRNRLVSIFTPDELERITFDAYSKILPKDQNSLCIVYNLMQADINGVDIKLHDSTLTWKQVYFRCTPQLRKRIMMSINREEWLQLLTDINPGTSPVFKSLNEITTAHDVYAKQRIAELLKTEKVLLVYKPEFEALVKEHGFTPFYSKAEFIIRGQEHGNCVANYFNKQCYNIHDAGIVSRLIKTQTSTCELNIEVAYNRIVSVRCQQYKGKYNKDITQTENLTVLRIALTGKPATLLYVDQTMTEEGV